MKTNNMEKLGGIESYLIQAFYVCSHHQRNSNSQEKVLPKVFIHPSTTAF